MSLHAVEVRTLNLVLKLSLGGQAQAGMRQIQEPRQPGNLLCLVLFRLFSQFPTLRHPDLKVDCVPPKREAEIMAEY